LSFVDVLDRLRRGENDAATEVFRRYAGQLVKLAEARLNPLLRQKVGPEDVMQSAFRTFFRRVEDGKFQLKNWDSLWGLLAVIVVRKCHKQERHFFGPTHDVRKEVPVPRAGESSDGGVLLRGPEPTPEEAGVLVETLEDLMRDLDNRDRQILQLRLQGHTASEIGELVGFTQFTVEGVLKKIRKRCKQLLDLE
jgi:RNA polymerase sigma-70 factor (ECF subfamily)